MIAVANERVNGLGCPLCNCPQSEVIWVRKRSLRIDGKLQGSIVRARECMNDNCRHRYQTNERISEEYEPRDQHRQSF